MPRAAGPWKQLTNFYLERGRWEEASSACQQYLDVYPSDSEFAIGVAGVLGQAGQDRLSIPILQKIVDHQPDYVSLISLGWALSDTGQRERGVTLIESAIPYDPESWWAYYHLGYVYRDMGKRDEALQAFREVLRRRPDYPEIEQQIGLLQQRR